MEATKGSQGSVAQSSAGQNQPQQTSQGGHVHSSPSYESPQTNAVSELYRLRDQFKLTQVELERERQSHRQDKASASLRIARLERRISTGSNSSADRNGTPGYRWARGLFTAIVLGLITLCAVLAMRNKMVLSDSHRVWRSKAPTIQLNPRPSIGTLNPPEVYAVKVHPFSRQQLDALGGPSDFSSAMARLDTALNSLPGSTQAILENVHSAGGSSICNFEWEYGQPAVVYRGGLQDASLSGTLNSCAEAVEQFQAVNPHAVNPHVMKLQSQAAKGPLH